MSPTFWIYARIYFYCRTVFPIEKRIEAYDGENEELDNLEA